MAGSEGSGLSDRGSQAPPGLGENLLSEVGIKFKIGSLQTEKGGSAVSCQVIGIALLEGGFLVAVPHAAWHRTGARRYLPPDSLVRPVLAEVLAAGEGDRREAHPVWRVKVWIGTLRADLAQSVIFGSSDEAATFGAGEEEAEVVFTIAGSGGGPGGPMPAVPFGPSLSAVANDHFAFVSAAEAPEEPQDRRLDAVEAAIAKLQTGMESLLSRLPGAGDLQGQAAPVQEPRPKASAAPPAGGVSAVGKALPGLDPAVVRSARAAGVPEVQLQRMSAMVSNARRLPAEPPRQGISPLDDEDEDLPAPDGGGDRATGNPLDAAVLKMSEILQHMHRDRRGGSVEDVLDRAEGGSDPTSVTLGAGKSKAAAYQRLKTFENPPAHFSRGDQSAHRDSDERGLYVSPERPRLGELAVFSPGVDRTSESASELCGPHSTGLDTGRHHRFPRRGRSRTRQGHRFAGLGQPRSGGCGWRQLGSSERNCPRGGSSFWVVRPTPSAGPVRGPTVSPAGQQVCEWTGAPTGVHPGGGFGSGGEAPGDEKGKGKGKDKDKEKPPRKPDPK